MSKRIEYIDVARGIGILLVVMAHNDLALVSVFLHQFIYSFHMPLFFFLSGMFFKPDITFVDLVKRRFRSVLQPYIVTILVIYAVSLSFSNMIIDVALLRMEKALYANGHYLDWVQLWFLPHLFVVSLFAFLFFFLVRKVKWPWFRWIVLAGILIVGVLTIGIFWPFSVNILGKSLLLYGLPFSIDLVLVSGFFFILGYETNRDALHAFFAKPWVLFLVGAASIALNVIFPDKSDFNTRLFDSLPVNTLEALVGIALVLALSKQIEIRSSKLTAMFSYIGQASLFILLFHVPIQQFWNDKILRETGNNTLSIVLAFFAGVIGPIIIYEYVVRPNPVISGWFGISPKSSDLSTKDTPPNPSGQAK